MYKGAVVTFMSGVRLMVVAMTVVAIIVAPVLAGAKPAHGAMAMDREMVADGVCCDSAIDHSVPEHKNGMDCGGCGMVLSCCFTSAIYFEPSAPGRLILSHLASLVLESSFLLSSSHTLGIERPPQILS